MAWPVHGLATEQHEMTGLKRRDDHFGPRFQGDELARFKHTARNFDLTRHQIESTLFMFSANRQPRPRIQPHVGIKQIGMGFYLSLIHISEPTRQAEISYA